MFAHGSSHIKRAGGKWALSAGCPQISTLLILTSAKGHVVKRGFA